MLIAGLVFCGVLLGITLLLGRGRHYGWVLLLQVVFFLGPPFLLMTVLVSLFWLTVVLGVLAVVALSVEMRSHVFNRWAVGLTLGVILATTAFGWHTYQETVARRKQFAFESIEDRLSPLETETDTEDELITVPQSILPGHTLAALATQESSLKYVFFRAEQRAGAIQRLHENTVQQFINSPGFGASRMSGWDRRLLKTEDSGPIPQPEFVEPPYVPDDQDPPAEMADHDPPSDELLHQLHVDGLMDFVNPEGFGYRNSQGQVAGFESHRFSEMPGSVEPMGNWTLARVELVSLLKSSEPRVYESEHLPRMDELEHASTRSVHPFEAQAVDRLRQGEDLVTEWRGSRLFAVGALRAMTQCVQCHSASRGDLLGAFSYEFRTSDSLPKSLDPDA